MTPARPRITHGARRAPTPTPARTGDTTPATPGVIVAPAIVAPTRRPAGISRRGGIRTAGLLVALVALVLAVTLSIAIGAKAIPAAEVLHGLFAPTGTDTDYIVRGLRTPRTLACIAVGASLGIAGALIQALTRNPLADPGILGVSSGAAFFVALATAAFGVTSVLGYVWFAFLGALVVTVAVYLIGSAGRGPADPIRLTLAGVALSAVLGGIITGMTLLNPTAFDRMRDWSAGSVAGTGLGVLAPVVPFLVAGLVLAGIVARPLSALALGDELAGALGANITRTRILVVIAVTLLAGGATAIAGPIGFVGLMVPHIARWITGPDQRWILAYTLVLAPILMLLADTLGRVALATGELPAGIVVSFVGAPVLIVLVRRRRTSRL